MTAGEVEAQHPAQSSISWLVGRQNQNVNEVAMEAGNSPDMIFKHYRELVTDKEADDWFRVTPDAVKAAKAAMEAELAAKVVTLERGCGTASTRTARG
jgi:hypothetical protein